jgi:hypothetical protein
MVSSTPLLTLDGATRRLVANSPTVATSTVARPRDSTFLDPLAREPCDRSEPAFGVPGIAIGGDSTVEAKCLQVEAKHLRLVFAKNEHRRDMGVTIQLRE